MKRLFSLLLAAAILASFAVPMTLAAVTADFTITLKPEAGVTPVEGERFTMEVHITNPKHMSIGSISNLTISFDESILKWANMGEAYNPEKPSTWPFAVGTIQDGIPSETGAKQLALNPPSTLGGNSGVFNFDSNVDFEAEGVLMYLYLVPKAAGTQVSVDLDVDSIRGFKQIEGDPNPAEDYVIPRGEDDKPLIMDTTPIDDLPPVDLPKDAILYGDANGDEVVDEEDVLLMIDWFNDKINTSIEAGADADGNGTVEEEDVLLMIDWFNDKINTKLGALA